MLTLLAEGSFPFLTHFPERTMDFWAKKFGPIYTFKLGSQLLLVLSDPSIVKDLMITNGAIFSSRKDMFMKAQTILARRGITGSGNTDRWYGDSHDASQFHHTFLTTS